MNKVVCVGQDDGSQCDRGALFVLLVYTEYTSPVLVAVVSKCIILIVLYSGPAVCHPIKIVVAAAPVPGSRPSGELRFYREDVVSDCTILQTGCSVAPPC